MLILESLFPLILLSYSSPIETRVRNRLMERVTRATILTTPLISSSSSNLSLAASGDYIVKKIGVYTEKKEREEKNT